MDDLYSNLENYDDVNAVDELRNENRELKHKLEECSKTMNQLQKDFDKLHSEYKKLEINYSSLLKTARAEIERKTQLITNLNKEKDMIVIRAMQGGCRNVLQNVNKPFHNYKNDTNKKDGGNKEILNRNKAGLSDNSREGSRESPMLLMKDKLSAPPANRSTSSERNVRQLDDAHSKENVSKTTQYQKHNIDKSKPRKISDRRKSMPVLSKAEEPVCSDGEIMKDDPTRDQNIFQDYDNVSHNSQYLESRGRQRTNRFEHYNRDSRQTFNQGVDRHNPHHDKYNLYNQNYDNYSPERGRHHQYSESDYFNRSEYRHRVLESPPKDKYGRSKSRDRRPRSRDSRREYDYYNSRYEDHYDARSDIREPDPKRKRIDSADREQYAHEGRERYLQEVERRRYRPSEYRPDVLSVDPHSCQSPDYDQIESNLSHHPIKEIKSTATVPLEDPRINSKKYSLKKSDQGIFISTVDKNTCMLPVNKTLWGFEKVEVPEALKANIWEEQTRDDIVNYIYMDIDDPANISSSKLCDKGKDSKIAETESIHNFDGQDRKEYIITDKIKQKLQKTNAPASKTILSGYKIPKQSKVDIKSKSSVQEKVIKNDGNTSNKNLALDDNKGNSNNLKTEVIDTIDKSKNQLVAPVEHNVEGDLELSDEESDITDELQITCKRNDNVSFSSYKNRDRDVEYDRDFKKKYHTNVKARQNDKTNKEINEDVSPKNIKDVSESIKDSLEKDKKMQDNDDNEKPCEEVTSTNKSETCKKKTLKNKYDIESPENKNIKMPKKANESFITETKKTRKRDKTPEKKDTQIIKTTDESSRVEARKQKKSEKSTEKKDMEIIEKDNESFRIEAKETRKREKRNRLSSKDTVQEKQESKFLHVGTSDNMHQNNCENKPKDSKPHNKFTELFGDSSSLITPEDLNIPTKFNISIEHNDNYGSLFENTQDAIDINVREIKEVSQTENNKIELLENVGTISNETDSPNIIHKKSLFEINDVPAVGDTFENLKTAVIDEDSNIVKTVVISSGIQPCLEENNTHVKNLTVANGNEVKEPEKVMKHQPLELLRAVATSTPHKMQHEQVSLSNAISTPNIENLDNDSNLSYSGSLTTTSNVEPNSDVPDVRIFIKRRRKIKK